MAQPYAGTVWRILDTSGNPVAGALVYTYEAGSLTPKSVYTNSSLTTATANPVVADASGFVQFWPGAGAYKFRVTYPVAQGGAEITAYAADNVVFSDEAAGTTSTIVNRETKTVTAGDTTTSITNGYTPGTNSIWAVSDSGLVLTSQNGDFTETNSTTITWATPYPVTETVTFFVGAMVTGGIDAADVGVSDDAGYFDSATVELILADLGARKVLDPSLAPFNADKTGSADCTAAFNSCYTAARALGAKVVPSPGTYKFNGSLQPSGTCTEGPGVFTRETATYTGRSVVFLHNGSGPLFAPTAPGWTVKGITFYDPNQPGTGASPVVRPPLIEPVTPARLVDFLFEDNIVVNAYDFISVPAGSVGGDVRIRNNRIYAIRFAFWLRAQCPEAWFVSDNIFSAGVYQTEAVFDNSAMLLKWTNANGAVFAVDMAGTSIDGLKTANNLFYGYHSVFSTVAGAFNVCTSTGDNFDAIDAVVRKQSTGSITGLTISGANVYSYQYTGGTRTARTRVFALSGSGSAEINVHSSRLQAADGDWLVDDSTGTTQFDFDGYVGPWGLASGLTGDAYAFRIDNANAEYNLRPHKVRASYTDSIGVSVARAAEVLVTGVPFNANKLPVQVDSTLASGGRVHITGNISRNTSGTKSLAVDAGVVSSVSAEGNRWDKTADVADA